MKNETLFNLGENVAMNIFGAPYHYLPWTEKLACKIIVAYVYTVVVFRNLIKR